MLVMVCLFQISLDEGLGLRATFVTLVPAHAGQLLGSAFKNACSSILQEKSEVLVLEVLMAHLRWYLILPCCSHSSLTVSYTHLTLPTILLV
eukprot:4312008-Pyramimonas_sp.AAC.1